MLALVASSVYYVVFGQLWLELGGVDPQTVVNAKPQIWEGLGQLGRNLVVAYVIARFVVRLNVVDWKGAIRLAIWLWFGFEAMAILGSVIHEAHPWQLYLIHTGDALMTALLMTLVIGVWRRKERAAEPGAAA